MSLHILSKKSNILHSKTNNNSSSSTKKNSNFKRFSNCCHNVLPVVDDATNTNIFSINDGSHKLRYIGKEYLNRQNKHNTCTRPSILKPSVINHSSYLKKRVLSEGNVVSNRFSNKSQTDYIHDITTDVTSKDNSEFIKNKNIQTSPICKNGCPMNYVKRIKTLNDYQEYLLLLKQNCQSL